MELSILIPSRCEEFLSNTIENILENSEAEIEVIAVLDGAPAVSPLPEDPRVHIIYLSKSVGQREATNIAARLATGKYVIKCDAHCTFDKGFDRKMLDFYKIVGDDVTAVPIMRNLHAFDWKCYHCGWKKYQGPTPEKCGQCGKTDRLRKKIMMIGKHNPQSTSYCFDSEPHFQYNEQYKHREPYITDKKEKGYTETMSLQGSFFMATREKYFELKLSDSALGNWGGQGIELACKTWLSGGRVLVNHACWYSHLFRTQGGNFSFPWPAGGRDTQKTKNNVKDLFWENKYEKQIYPLSWLIKKFMPVSNWNEESLNSLLQSEASLPDLRKKELGLLGVVPVIPSPMTD